MDMVSFSPDSLVLWLAPLLLVALVAVVLVAGVAVDAVVRHHATRVARHESRRSYYGALLHLHGAQPAH